MATPELVIAKATLSATLFRADPTSLSRPVVDAFFPLLTNALSQCSRPNVQKCKAWIVDNVAPSPARIAALAKYLGILSKSFQDDASRPSLKRKRLHLLYVLNDVFYHVIKRKGDGKFATLWDGALPGLVASAAAFDNCPKHKAKLENLIRLWEEKKYFGADIVSKLKDALASGVASQPTEPPQISNAPIKLAKDAPYTLPSFHGDPSTPWYDLPATTWLPYLTPNSTKPMIPDLIRPIQLAPGPADKVLVDAVQGLLGEVERMFSREQKLNDEPGVDLNELGERVLLDEITGEIIGGETYYGWSRQFCEKMKERRRKGSRGGNRGRSRSRSSSYSRGRSRSSSRHAPKRRRLSRDSRGRSLSHSRSPSQHRGSRSYSRGRDGSRSRRRSPSYTPSRSPNPGRRHDRSRGHRSYSRSRSPERSPRRHDREFHDRSNRPPPPPPQQLPPNFPPIPPPGDFPVPPPPPAGYQGPWPPPPPPPHLTGGPQGWFPNPQMIPQMMGGWGVPPPPQPSPHHGYQGGRGNGGFRGRGRGGYDRGRGGW
ncbi:hypothetical protein LCI18_004396 [Fusarium solani-melongenae]|uniref:Uncharacterized protein n=1 Tax=Fusarium solani subsp. cucurbitae TaxID=2747967 RepID=A0ACD3YWZ7_FUSSC|nr:hypothetical protein LCI18_004396 [Fusarium solani-melongenae]